MNPCPKCGQPADENAACNSCGDAIPRVEVLPADRALSVMPHATTAAVLSTRSKLPLALIAIAVIGVGALMVPASATRSATASATVAAAPHDAEAVRDGDSRPAAGPVAAPANAPVPRWTTSGPSRSGRAGASTIALELAATQDVDVWRKRVRPVLTVRCAARTVEVFVVTHSAASIEGNGREHTVQVGFDEGDAVPQMWEHSVDHDALFAPDGRALVSRIAGARLMTFRYSPFNAPPVLMTFGVEGLDARLKSVAKNACS